MTQADIRPPRPDRRAALVTLAAAGIVGLAGSAGLRYAFRPASDGRLITPPEALDLSLSGEAVLVDIRRPDEWKRTGIGTGAVPIDMRRDDFIPALDATLGGDRTRAVVLICAGGVRSRILAQRLESAGFTDVIDVPEGMQGSRAGPGWLRRGMPTVVYQED